MFFFSTCAAIIKQLFTSVSVNSSGYLPRRFAAREISTIITSLSMNNG